MLQTNLAGSLLLYLSVSGAACLLFAFFGYPIACLTGIRDSDPFGARTMLLGMSVLAGISWLWQSLSGLGLFPFSYVLLAANTVPVAFLAHRRLGGTKSGEIVGSLRWPLATFILSLGTFARYFRETLSGHGLAPASLGNNDLALYATVADHLQRHGFEDPGAIPGVALGHEAHDGYYGAYQTLGQVGGLLHIDIVFTVMPLILAGMFLLSGALASVLVLSCSMTRWHALAIGWIATSTSMYFYLVGNGFLGQLLALPLFALLVIHAIRKDDPSIRRRRGDQIEATLLAMGLLLVYPHMALLGIPLVCGAAVLNHLIGISPTRRWRDVPVAELVSALLLACLLIPNRGIVAVHTLVSIGDAVNGWTLHRAQVAQIFGFQVYPNEVATAPTASNHDLAEQAISWRVVLLVALGTIALLLLIRAAVRDARNPTEGTTITWLMALLTTCLASYYVFYGYYGPGYQHWKWLSFVQPILLMAGLGLVLQLVMHEAASRPWPIPTIRAVTGIFLALPAAVVISTPASPHGLQVTPALRAVVDSTEIKSARLVNVSAGDSPTPYWDAMWIVYFLHGRAVRITSPTYYATSPPVDSAATVRVGADRSLEIVPAAR